MTRFKTAFASTLLIMGCTFASAQSSTNEEVVPDTSTTYNFETVDFSGDLFTQLLGINNSNEIAGYHGSGATGHPNKGFTLTLPKTFVAENFPGSAQTQVIGINSRGETDGFYVDVKGNTHGFIDIKGVFKTVDFPGTTFNQLLGLNALDQAAGYWQDAAGNFHPYIWNKSGNVFFAIILPSSNSVSAQATSINDLQAVAGFFIDKKGVNHGFLLAQGAFNQLDFPGSTFTQALGVNNHNEVVGTYTDKGGNIHGFTWRHGQYASVDDPSGVGTTIVNGVNDNGDIVGFYGNTAAGISHGFVGKPI